MSNSDILLFLGQFRSTHVHTKKGQKSRTFQGLSSTKLIDFQDRSIVIESNLKTALECREHRWNFSSEIFMELEENSRILSTMTKEYLFLKDFKALKKQCTFKDFKDLYEACTHRTKVTESKL